LSANRRESYARADKKKYGYDVHPSLAMMRSTIAGMKQRTGRTLEEWVELVTKKGPATEKERRAWLKAKHGLGMNYSWWIAEQSVGKSDDSDPDTYLRNAEQYVETMFSGSKAGLRPNLRRAAQTGAESRR